MLVDDHARSELRRRLSVVLGDPEATTLMSLLDEDRFAALATHADVEDLAARTDARFDAMDARFDAMEARFDERFAAQDRRTEDGFKAQDRRIEDGFKAQDRRIDEGFAAQDRRFEEGFLAQRELLAEQLDAMEHRITAVFRKEINDAILRQGRSTAIALAGTVAAMAGVIIAVG